MITLDDSQFRTTVASTGVEQSTAMIARSNGQGQGMGANTVPNLNAGKDRSGGFSVA